MAVGHSSGEAAALLIDPGALDPGAGLVITIALAAVLTVFALIRDPLALAGAAGVGAPCESLSDLLGPRRSGRDGRSPGAPHAVVEARIDQFRAMPRLMGEEALREAVEGFAAILRGGLRRGDSLRTIPGEGFVIVLEGTREVEAAGIAGRLRRALARTRVPGLADMIRVTASFGVAEARLGESPEATRARAASALDAAMAQGEDCVVMASEIEEVLFLPPPALRLTASDSRAA